MCKSQNNVVKQFINQAIESKDKIAIEYGNTIMTYEQLHKKAIDYVVCFDWHRSHLETVYL